MLGWNRFWKSSLIWKMHYRKNSCKKPQLRSYKAVVYMTILYLYLAT